MSGEQGMGRGVLDRWFRNRRRSDVVPGVVVARENARERWRETFNPLWEPRPPFSFAQHDWFLDAVARWGYPGAQVRALLRGRGHVRESVGWAFNGVHYGVYVDDDGLGGYTSKAWGPGRESVRFTREAPTETQLRELTQSAWQ